MRGIHSKKKVQQWVENPPGVFGGGKIAGLGHDDTEPQNAAIQVLSRCFWAGFKRGFPGLYSTA